MMNMRDFDLTGDIRLANLDSKPSQGFTIDLPDSLNIDEAVNKALLEPSNTETPTDYGVGFRISHPIYFGKSIYALELFLECRTRETPANPSGFTNKDTVVTEGVMIRKHLGKSDSGADRFIGSYVPLDTFKQLYIKDDAARIRIDRWFDDARTDQQKVINDQDFVDEINVKWESLKGRHKLWSRTLT